MCHKSMNTHDMHTYQKPYTKTDLHAPIMAGSDTGIEFKVGGASLANGLKVY